MNVHASTDANFRRTLRIAMDGCRVGKGEM